MHLTSIHRVLVLAVAAVAGAYFLTAPAPADVAQRAADPAISRTDVARSTHIVKYGAYVSIFGLVTASGGTLQSNGVVRLERQLHGQSEQSTFSKRALTSAPPRWTFRPSRTGTYQLYFLGKTGVITASTSDYVRIAVRRNLNDRWRSTDRTYYGKVLPNYRGRPVYIQRSTCTSPSSGSCSWSAYKTVTTNTYGNWAVRLPNPASRTHFRGYVPPSNGYGGALSNRIVTLY